MSSARVTGFTETRGCPSSQDLVLYQSAEFSAVEAGRIISHTTAPDFCAAELDSLCKYPSTAVTFGDEEMLHLRSLAERLLFRDYAGTGRLTASRLSKTSKTVTTDLFALFVARGKLLIDPN